jgi:hypothetical protein
MSLSQIVVEKPFTSTDLMNTFETNDISFIRCCFENSTNVRIDHNVSFKAAETGNMKIFDLVIDHHWSFCPLAFIVIGKMGQIEHIQSIYNRLKHRSVHVRKMMCDGFIEGAYYCGNKNTYNLVLETIKHFD